MSLHASKGLEFDVVFMVGVENGLLPHRKAVLERPDAGLAEERRLCYVGFTRARKQLFVSYCQQRQAAFIRGKGVQFAQVRPSALSTVDFSPTFALDHPDPRYGANNGERGG